MTYYYFIGNRVVGYEAKLDKSLYNYQQLTTKQKNFYLANPSATKSEIIALELEPIPEPIPMPYVPSFEERLQILENLELERILES